MHAFDVLGDPVRRRILDLLASGEMAAGEIGAVIQEEFGVTQPAVSAHLRVLRDSGFAVMRPEGRRRLYAANPTPLREVAAWVGRNRRHWEESFDSLDAHLSKLQGRPVLSGKSRATSRRTS
jgi:DNA-binding transcriptional ArsR family regulator